MKLYRRLAWFTALAAVGSCWCAARAEGIQVYQGNTRVGATSQNVLNCIPPARCGIGGNAVTVGVDAGAGVTPAAVCGDSTHALGWDGGAYYCATVGASSPSFLEATLTAVRSSNLAVSDHVPFDSARVSGGSLISLDTTTLYTTTQNVASKGRVTLTGGHTYRIVFTVGYANFSGGGGYVHLALWNSTTNAIIGQATQVTPSTGTSNNFGNGVLLAHFTAAADTLIEVKITVVNALSDLGQTSTGANHFPTMLVESIN